MPHSRACDPLTPMNSTTPPSAAPSSIGWLDDGTPFSNRFNDRYHSNKNGGVTQAESSFLHGCHLPQAWANAPSWCVLETGFGLGLNFLVTWQAWRDDPERPAQLHFVSTEAWPVNAEDLLAAAQHGYPHLLPLAQELAQQYWDMHSGLHRISLDNNRVHLSLAIGDAKQWLRSQPWQADSVYLDGFKPTKNPELWSLDTLKAIARCCKVGHTRLATWSVARRVRDALEQCGFTAERVPGTPPKDHNLQALYAPAWSPKKREHDSLFTPPLPAALRASSARRCVVIGAGIAGASTARAMAERGWQVCVIDSAHGIAQGASALPAGLFAPHITPDDAPLSRLTREGIRATRKTAQRLLREGMDWQASGVIEHRVDKKSGLAKSRDEADHPSHASLSATFEQRIQAGIDAPQTAAPAEADSTTTAQHPAIWHAYAGWIKPGKLVAALLDHPLIEVRTATQALAITPCPQQAADAPWRKWQIALASTAQTANALVLEPLQADCLILAAAHHSKALLAPLGNASWPLNAVRGQVAWGEVPGQDAAQWPAWPINGKGSLIRVPLDGSAPDAQEAQPADSFWISGGTFEREHPLEQPDAAKVAAALEANRQRLDLLMPASGHALAAQLFENAQAPVRHWSGVRCTVPDRTPLYGAVNAEQPNLLLAAGLGSRGLTLSLLCAEALVCALHEEPLPMEQALAKLVSTARLH